jgi:hypothetical protein
MLPHEQSTHVRELTIAERPEVNKASANVLKEFDRGESHHLVASCAMKDEKKSA